MPKPRKPDSRVTIRLDVASKAAVVEAARKLGLGVGEFVRRVVVTQARKDVRAAQDETISLTPAEQLAFWKALSAPVKLSPAQQRLGRKMRGEY